jgi:uncharacterized protein (TIGR03435 family)
MPGTGKILAASAAVVLYGWAARAQTSDPPLAFEVAVVKPSMPFAERIALMQAGRMPTTGITYKHDRVDIGFQTLGELICAAFSVQRYRIAGPDWLLSEMKSPASVYDTHVFDIHARMPTGTDRRQAPQMLETLLNERFGMKTHPEKRTLAVYALETLPNGPKMRPGAEPEAAPAEGTVAGGLDNGEEQVVQPIPQGSVVWAPGGCGRSSAGTASTLRAPTRQCPDLPK